MSLKNATKLENSRVELEIEVDAVAFGAAVDAAYKKDVKKMSVPGFRKGKAPRAMIEKMYGTGVFYETAMNDVYPTALDAAIKESGYEYVEDKIDLDVVNVGPEGLVFKAVITVKPEVKMRGHKSLKITRPAVVVTDEDIEAEYAALAEKYSLELDKVKNMVALEEIRTNLETRKAVKVIVDSAVAVAPKTEEKTEE